MPLDEPRVGGRVELNVSWARTGSQVVILFVVANGVYQNSLYGVAAYLPMKYTNAVIIGTVRNIFISFILFIATQA